MPKDKQSNPIYERLTRQTNGPSMWLVVVISTGIGLTVLVAALTSLDKGYLSGFILLAALAIDLISPAVIAAYAANLVAKDLQTENWQMMKLTGISEGTLVKGYARAAFRRMRLLAAVASALTPTIVITGSAIITMAVEPSTPLPDLSLPGIGRLVLGYLLIVAPFILGLWFFHKLTSLWGAFLAIWWKQPLLVMIVSSYTILIFAPIIFYIFTGIMFFLVGMVALLIYLAGLLIGSVVI